MRARRCTVETCGKNKLGHCESAGPRCSVGVFLTIVDGLSRFGAWKVREYATGPMKATLRGSAGRVEVWGGQHAREVWFIERGTQAETLVTEDWSVRDGSLEAAVARACALAGVQTEMEV